MDFYSNLKGSAYSIYEKNHEMKIIMPFFLTGNRLNNLIFSQGQFTITKGDSVLFNSNSIEKIYTDFNVLGQAGVSIKLKEKYKQKLKDFSIKHQNQHIKILIDSTIFMRPKIRDTISTGIFSLAVPKTKNYDADIVYAVINYPYNESVKMEGLKKRLFLKSDKKLVEVSPELYIIYGNIRKLILKNRKRLSSDLRLLNQKEKFIIEKEILNFLENDLSGYLAASGYSEIKGLKKSLLNLNKALKKYDSGNELTNMIKSINELTEFEFFKLE